MFQFSATIEHVNAIVQFSAIIEHEKHSLERHHDTHHEYLSNNLNFHSDGLELAAPHQNYDSA